MQTYNYHTHTKRCNHATGEDRAFADAAIKCGICKLGFSDHVPYLGFPGDYYSHFRMRPEQTSDYITSINSLKSEYKGSLEIFTGFEAEYYPALFPDLLDFLREFNPDYLILGQHFTNNETDGEYTGFLCSEASLISYANQVCDAMKTGCFSYVAHPDIPSFNGSGDIYRREMEKICRTALELDIPLEYNLLGLRASRIYPNPDFFEIAAEVGNKIVVGVDAHEPDAFFRDDIWSAAEENLRRLGIKTETDIELRKVFK